MKKVKAIIEPLEQKLLDQIELLLLESRRQNGKLINYLDTDTNISYGISFDIDKLMVSVVDFASYPNASLLPYLTRKYGQPSYMYSKRWALDNRALILFMSWDYPISAIKSEKSGDFLVRQVYQ